MVEKFVLNLTMKSKSVQILKDSRNSAIDIY